MNYLRKIAISFLLILSLCFGMINLTSVDHAYAETVFEVEPNETEKDAIAVNVDDWYSGEIGSYDLYKSRGNKSDFDFIKFNLLGGKRYKVKMQNSAFFYRILPERYRTLVIYLDKPDGSSDLVSLYFGYGYTSYSFVAPTTGVYYLQLFNYTDTLTQTEHYYSIGIFGECYSHEYGNWEIIEEPTCTKEGTKKGICVNCGREQLEVIPPEHSFESWIITKEATCSEEGSMERTCSKCGEKQTEAIKKIAHKYGDWEIVKEATCLEEGSMERTCSSCGEKQTKTIEKNAHKYGEWEVIKEATDVDSGLKKRTCTGCGTIVQAEIPALLPSVVSGEVSPMSPALTEAVENQLSSANNDSDPKGSTFGLLRAKGVAKSKTAITVSWNKVPGANSYIVYGNNCGKGKPYRKIETVSGTSFQQKGLKKGTYYKYVIIAANGKKALAISKTIHVATKGGKVGNNKKVTTKAKKNKVSLKTGKTFKLSAKAIPQSSKLKVKKHRAIKYETSNKNVATVNSKGVITAKGKGSCKIYSYAQNGVCASITVNVK